jgi:DNA processing protein
MAFFFSEKERNAYICYFTLYEILNRSFTKTNALYQEIKDEDDWEYITPQLMVIDPKDVSLAREKVEKNIDLLDKFDIIAKKGSKFYPKRLEKLDDSPEFLFMRGEPSLADLPVISIVGSRKASKEGQNKARLLSRLLSERNIIVASGLARGIDYAAHLGTYDAGKPTIAVIGTPLNKVYPKEHKRLQEYIGSTGLVISQFPPGAPVQRWNFPMRNATMSGISIATIVMEAGETSGALIQAREALKQGRKVFIPQSAIDNENLKWPRKLVAEKGAHKFRTLGELMELLNNQNLLTSYVDKDKSEIITYGEME